MLALAARSDGWTHANWGAADTNAFREASARLDEELAKVLRLPAQRKRAG